MAYVYLSICLSRRAGAAITGERQRPQSPRRAPNELCSSSHAVGNMGARHSGQVAASSPLRTQASMHAAWNTCEQPHSSTTVWKSPCSRPAKQIAQTAAPSASPSASSWTSAGCAGATRRRLYRGAVSDRVTVSHSLASRRRSKSTSLACSPTPPKACPGRCTSPWHGATPRRSRITPAMKRRRSRRSRRSRRFRRRGSS
jgi:hypothetical protein